MEAVTRLHGLAGPMLLAALAVVTLGSAALALLGRGPVGWADMARRIVLALVVVQAALGVALTLRGSAPAEWIHWLYGVAIVLVLLAPAALQSRAGTRSADAVLVITLALATVFAWRLWGSG